MSWDSVPWFIGGGAQHSPEIARLLAYAATSGSEGVVGVSDLSIRTTAVPSAYVRALPGACVIRNRGAGGTLQTYIGRLPSEDVVGIAPTGSSGGRNDLVIARVEDPFAAGTPWQDPDDPTKGPYIFTRVIPNVPASAIASPDAARKYLRALGYSAIALAGVTLPASTGTVTASMITPLREMANPRRKRDLNTLNLSTSETQTNTGDGGEQWPNVAAWTIEVPEWATQVRVRADWAQIKVPAGNAIGNLWVQFGANGAASTVSTKSVGYNTPGSSGDARSTFTCADTLWIPAAMRGTNVFVNMRAKLSSTSSSGARLIADQWAAMVLDLEFLERPVEDDF